MQSEYVYQIVHKDYYRLWPDIYEPVTITKFIALFNKVYNDFITTCEPHLLLEQPINVTSDLLNSLQPNIPLYLTKKDPSKFIYIMSIDNYKR